VLGSILNQLVGNLGLIGDVLAANLVSAQTEWAALSGAGWALSPADSADALGAMVARRIAEGAALFLVCVAE